jgi:hypothetical protein
MAGLSRGQEEFVYGSHQGASRLGGWGFSGASRRGPGLGGHAEGLLGVREELTGLGEALRVED